MNRVELMGRLVRDPEYGMTKYETPWSSFTIVVDGEPRWDAEKKLSIAPSNFISCMIFGSEAKQVRTFSKGDKLWVTGELSQEEVELEDGRRSSKTRVKAHVVWPVEFKRTEATDPPEATF